MHTHFFHFVCIYVCVCVCWLVCMESIKYREVIEDTLQRVWVDDDGIFAAQTVYR